MTKSRARHGNSAAELGRDGALARRWPELRLPRTTARTGSQWSRMSAAAGSEPWQPTRLRVRVGGGGFAHQVGHADRLHAVSQREPFPRRDRRRSGASGGCPDRRPESPAPAWVRRRASLRWPKAGLEAVPAPGRTRRPGACGRRRRRRGGGAARRRFSITNASSSGRRPDAPAVRPASGCPAGRGRSPLSRMRSRGAFRSLLPVFEVQGSIRRTSSRSTNRSRYRDTVASRIPSPEASAARFTGPPCWWASMVSRRRRVSIGSGRGANSGMSRPRMAAIRSRRISKLVRSSGARKLVGKPPRSQSRSSAPGVAAVSSASNGARDSKAIRPVSVSADWRSSRIEAEPRIRKRPAVSPRRRPSSMTPRSARNRSGAWWISSRMTSRCSWRARKAARLREAGGVLRVGEVEIERFGLLRDRAGKRRLAALPGGRPAPPPVGGPGRGAAIFGLFWAASAQK